MEEIRRAAAAYYENLPVANKRYARYIFSSMDKNGDGQINLKEYVEYLDKDNKTALAHPSLFRALDKNNNGSLDFEEVIVLYYITQSGRALFCKSCDTFLTDVYFSCSQCFFKGDSVSTFDICCDCYGGKKFKHHDGAIFCDNYTLLSRSRRLAVQASKEEQSSVVKEIDIIAKVAKTMQEILQAYLEKQSSVAGEIDSETIASIANLMSDAKEASVDVGSSVFAQIDLETIANVANSAVDAGCIIM
ncbi:calcium-dependent protein [Salix suchowensis]|nr:calcium-dependent protein [Salix suchowensis]